MCPAGCGISVRTREGRPKIIQGNPSHPVSQGTAVRTGPGRRAGAVQPRSPDDSAAANGERGDGAFEPTTWEDGLSRLADRLRPLRANGQGDRVCLLSEGVRGHLALVFERFMEQLGSKRLLHYDFAHPQHAVRGQRAAVRRATPAVLRPEERALSAVLRRRLSRPVDLAGASQPRLRPQSTGSAASMRRALRADRAAHVAERSGGR